MGSAALNLDQLLALPAGCGEQNMIRFAPSVQVRRYLEHTHQMTDAVGDRIDERLVQSYQRQMTYRRMDGSYSAFGNRDTVGNMWYAH